MRCVCVEKHAIQRLFLKIDQNWKNIKYNHNYNFMHLYNIVQPH